MFLTNYRRAVFLFVAFLLLHRHNIIIMTYHVTEKKTKKKKEEETTEQRHTGWSQIWMIENSVFVCADRNLSIEIKTIVDSYWSSSIKEREKKKFLIYIYLFICNFNQLSSSFVLSLLLDSYYLFCLQGTIW